VLDEIAGEKLSDEELLQREAEKSAQRVVNAARVHYRQEEYEVRTRFTII
jgi:hypothetical protein